MRVKLNSPVQKARSVLLSNNAITLHLEKLGYPEKSLESMKKCGETSKGFIIKSCGCGNKIIQLAHRCNLRTCPYCSKTRKRRIRRKYLDFLSNLAQDRTNFLYFLTISPKNYKDLDYGMKHIRESFQKFLRLKYIKERIKAGLYVIEAKKSGDSWNIHIHAIVYGRFLDNRIRGKCSDCGQNLIKFDYVNKKFYCASRRCSSLNVTHKKDSQIVYLWKKSSDRDVNFHITRQSSSSFTLNYMLKYISANKDDFDTPEDIAVYIKSTYKRRLINTFGMFYRLKLKKPIYVCPKCNQIVHFFMDFTVMMELLKVQDSVKPPDIFKYI